MSSEPEQQDLADYTPGCTGEWVWRCSCGKESVFPVDRQRAERRAQGHQINCNHQGTTEIVPADDE